MFIRIVFCLELPVSIGCPKVTKWVSLLVKSK